MGKTEKGAVWLNENLFSPYDYWQFWRNTDDRDVKRFLNYFTELEVSEIDIICNKEKNINNLKILLANEATKILHGKLASEKAEQIAKQTFESGGISLGLPEFKIKSIEIENGIDILDFLSQNNKILTSKRAVRRIISNRVLKINNVTINEEKKLLQLNDFKDKISKISLGKKRHFIIKII